MTKILSLALRPRTLSGLYGQETIVAAIRNHMAKRPPSAWMFVGPSGSGKTTSARILSVALQCKHMKLWGDPCDDCWNRRDEFAIHEIDATDASGVDEIGEVVRLSRFKPSNPDGKRVIIIDEIHMLSKSSVNLLLKPTEEPPATTVWIACTTDPAKVLATLRRRFVTYQMKLLGISESEKFLQKQASKAGIARPLEDLFEQCHLTQISSPALLLQALEKFAAGNSATESVSGAGSKIDAFKIAQSVAKGDWKSIRDSLKDITSDDVRYIRAVVSGYLKTIMSRSNSTSESDRAAVSIMELCSMPFDDSVSVNWLWSVLCKISSRYKR